HRIRTREPIHTHESPSTKRTRTLLAIVAALLPVPLLLADVTHPPRCPIAVYDLAALPPRDSARLEGRLALYHVELDSNPADVDGRTAFDCVGNTEEFPMVWLIQGQEIE